MRRRWLTGLLAVALVAAVGPASAAPNDDGQPAGAPSHYDATAPTGWMTSAATDRVQDIAQIGNTVYVAGTFAGIRPTRTGPITPRTNIAAFDATTGEPRAGFAPAVNSTVYTLEPSADGTRLYLGGSFTSVNGVAHNRVVAIDPSTGATVSGFNPNLGGGSVHSIVVRAGVLYAGGTFTTASGQARTGLAAFDTSGTGAPLSTWVPSANGTGGVLTIEASPDGSRLYVGGRFADVNGQPSTAYLAALHRATGVVDTSFAAQPGREVFDVLADERGLVWTALGGSLGRSDVYRAADGSLLTRHETAGDVETVEQVGDLIYLGGHDIGPTELEHIGVIDPAAPAILDAAEFDEPTTGGDGTWAIHSTGSALWVGGNVSGPYFGFAFYPSVPDPPDRVELLPVLSPWRYLDTAAAPSGWTAPAFDDSAWPTGPAELGFGDGGEATLLRSGRGTYSFRRTFTATDVASLTDLRLDLLADDGAAVYLNGTEVARVNLPAGPLSDGTRAVVGLSGNPEDSFTAFDVPSSALVEGTNTVAVEVHQNASASSDLSFDARFSAVRVAGPAPDTTPPSVPTGLTASGVTHQTASLSWNPSTDAVGVDHYEVRQDGALIGSPTQPTLSVIGLSPSTTYAFRVEAVDAAGNHSGLSPVRSVTTAAAPSAPVDLVARGATWRYRDDGWDGGNGAWRDTGFDDSTWRQGPAELGLDDGDEATVIGGRYLTTTHFRRTFTVTGASSITDLQLELLADDGALAFVNGTEVARDNLPSGPITSSTNAVAYRTGLAETQRTTFGLAPGVLREGTNVLAIEVHQASGSPDVSFDARLRATAGTSDTSAPSVPSGLASPARTATTVDLSWAASTDDRAVARYEVFVDGSSVGTTTGRTFTVTGLAPSSTHGFAVEALDAAGNRSGRSAPLSVTTLAGAPTSVQVIARGATWRYRDVGTAPPATWAQRTFDDNAWSQGSAILGREEGDEATVLAPGTGARWFRRTFPIAGASSVTALRLDLVADDGAVVYLNGTEVVRDNLPTGPLTADTLAAGYRTGAAERTVRTFTIPPSALVTGANVLAVELHQASGSPDASFDAALTATGAAADTTAPSTPTGLTSPARTSSSIDLSWTAATDDVAVQRYEVFRNGTSVGTANGTSFTVAGLAPSTSYSLAVEAIDAAGNRSARSNALNVSTTAAAGGPVTFIPRGDTWRWWNAATAPPAPWTSRTYDDTAWATGQAELGNGDGDEVTVVPAGYGTRWFRRGFTVSGAASVANLEIEVLADDGAVIYLNGVELARDNVGPGTVTADTLATDYRFGVAETQRHVYVVPASALVDGTNVLAVSVHQAYGSPDISFDLRLRSA